MAELVSPGAWESHIHVFDPNHFETYTPQQTIQRSAGATRCGAWRISIPTTYSEKLDDLGVRCVRFHWGYGDAEQKSNDVFRDLGAVSDKTARLGWVVDVFCPLAVWADMADNMRNLDPRTRVVAEHFGGAGPGDEEGAEFRTLLQLLREKRVYFELSAFTRLCHDHPAGLDAMAPLVKAVVEAGPDRVPYGSDWPRIQPGFPREGRQRSSA
ncbi:hypothetical protein LTR37_000005 [Vermiconidia calcicola]|uniref:Uncharacterized protein n=1 Tax=Vermiconidia calcicola TaxID=1690605 RepID=A0ACC3P0P5_9PEZI|nr:hypothetical protein LTR37_000005 [Vermiconidia calcicola]